jgi:hypothetical protein
MKTKMKIDSRAYVWASKGNDCTRNSFPCPGVAFLFAALEGGQHTHGARASWGGLGVAVGAF